MCGCVRTDVHTHTHTYINLYLVFFKSLLQNSLLIKSTDYDSIIVIYVIYSVTFYRASGKYKMWLPLRYWIFAFTVGFIQATGTVTVLSLHIIYLSTCLYLLPVHLQTNSISYSYAHKLTEHVVCAHSTIIFNYSIYCA